MLITLISCNSSNNKSKSDLEKLNLKGIVRSVKESQFEVHKEFGEFTKGGPKENSSYSGMYSEPVYLEIELKEFNLNGFLILKNVFDITNKLLYDQTYKYENDKLIEQSGGYIQGSRETTKYTYYDNGDLKYEKTYGQGLEKNELVDDILNAKTEFKTDKEGKLTKITFYDNGNIKRKYVYDAKNNLTDKEYYKYTGEKSSKDSIEYSYDNNDRLITKKYWIGDELNERFYAYDDKFNEMSYITKVEGINDSKSVYSYDDYGNDLIIEEFKYDLGNDEFILKTKNNFLYKYDDKDNWIEKIEFLNGIAQSLTERVFEYHD